MSKTPDTHEDFCLVCGAAPCVTQNICQATWAANENPLWGNPDARPPHQYKPANKLTVKTESGTETVYVHQNDDPNIDHEHVYVPPNEMEMELASSVVWEIGDMTDIELEDYGDQLQDLIEDAIVATREAVLEVVDNFCNPADYELVSKIIRGGM